MTKQQQLSALSGVLTINDTHEQLENNNLTFQTWVYPRQASCQRGFFLMVIEEILMWEVGVQIQQSAVADAKSKAARKVL